MKQLRVMKASLISLYNKILPLGWRYYARLALVIFFFVYPVFCLWINKLDIRVTYIITSVLFAAPFAHLLCCLKNRVVFSILLFVIMLLSMIETGMVVLSDGFITAGNLLAILQTNTSEGGGFISSNLLIGLWFIPLLIVYIIHFWVWRKQTINICHHLMGFAIWFTLAFCYAGYKMIRPQIEKYLAERVLNRPPFNFFAQSGNIIKIYKQRQLIEESENFTFGAYRDSVPQQRECYVLAIGESMRYANVSVNGQYERGTTPLLEATSDITLYTDYYTGGTLTMFAVPQLLTRATPESFERSFTEKSILQVFNECGFSCFVIDNGKFLYDEAHLTRGAKTIEVYEDGLIPLLVDSLSSMYEKTFFVIKLLGSHYPYDNYPKEFEYFTPNSNTVANAGEGYLWMNSYDNTIRYTDYILSSIIKTINNQNIISSFLYVSDHGEVLKPDGGYHGGSMPQETEYHVPLIIWNNDYWRRMYAEKQSNMNKNNSTSIHSNNVFYSVYDMADIVIPSDSAIINNMSIFRSTLQANKKRNVLMSDGVEIKVVDGIVWTF